MSEILVGSNPVVTGPDEHNVFRSDQPDQYIILGQRTLVGGSGDDWYYVTGQTKVVEQADGGADIITSSTNYVLPDNVETLVVWGTSAAVGNNQANTLVGSSQSNFFNGMGGDDVLFGGGGADTYQFDAASGHDVIASWNGSSKVRLAGYDTFHTLADVQAAMTQVGSNVVLHLSDADDVTFVNSKIGDFTNDNFQYRLDTSHMTLSFDDEFDAFSARAGRDATSGTWNTEQGGGPSSDSVEARTLTSNSEKELYVDPGFKGTGDTALGLNPFSIDKGVLTITAAPTPDAVKEALSGYDYTSGYLSTRDSFSQTYGYFEARLQLASGQGAWPAFWMFRKDGTWPPELDILEAWNDTTSVQTVHSQQLGYHTTSAGSTFVPDGDTSFHNYGFLWTAETLTWYLDGVAVFSAPTPADMHSPMYLILNLAVSNQVQDPNFTTQMKVDYVHAYTLDDMPLTAEQTIDPATGHGYWGPEAGVYDGFNAAYYLAHNPDVAASGLTAITHYAEHGKAEGRLPYDGANGTAPDTAPVVTAPIVTAPVITAPADGGIEGNGVLPVATAPADPTSHGYWGAITGEPDGFNAAYYAAHNPDVVAAGMDLLSHYEQYGKAEGRLAYDGTVVTTDPVPVDPSPADSSPVDATPVAKPVETAQPDSISVVVAPVDGAPDTQGAPPVATAPAEATTHGYWGSVAGEPDGFNAAYYAAHNPDVVAAGMDLLSHYEQYGKGEGRLAYDGTAVTTDPVPVTLPAETTPTDSAPVVIAPDAPVTPTPTPAAPAPSSVFWGADPGQPDGFNATYYAAHNPDVVAAGMDLLFHYERYGKAEGRLAYDGEAAQDVAAAAPVATVPVAIDPVPTSATAPTHDPVVATTSALVQEAAPAADAVPASSDVAAPVVPAVYDLAAHTLHATVATKLPLDMNVLFLEGNAREGWANANGSTLLANTSFSSTLHGGDGNDILHASGLGDTLIGGNGDDTYWVGSVKDKVTETATGGWDVVNSTVDYHAPKGIEQVNLSGTAITAWANNNGTILAGNALDNHLVGGSGNDSLWGGDGNDRLNGGGGKDELTGGAGHDTFIFKPGSGYDTIRDFDPAEDKLDVTALFKKYGAPTVTDIPWESGSMVHFAGGETILLLGVSHADAVYAAHG